MSTRKWFLVLPAVAVAGLAWVVLVGTRGGGASQAAAQEGGGTLKVGKYTYVSSLFTILKIDTSTGKTYSLAPPQIGGPFDRDMMEMAWVPVEHFDSAEEFRKWFRERSQMYRFGFDKDRFWGKDKEKGPIKDFTDKKEFDKEKFFDKDKFFEKDAAKDRFLDKERKLSDKGPAFDKKRD